ncbi:hypothetical protein CR205_16295 [Alteribacter lacisalsi]|uniref:Uncharacterized protein n=1 Tax=Alteribacter lacisalsi TaxID=2045244 RepID=A0A2W0H5N3_9BACI|nr:hypothetical protein [Alteribacter lacisalsi]PYZ95936.1 hypothetical protein CR205_16295 [Alteribacter lacisalsi]
MGIGLKVAGVGIAGAVVAGGTLVFTGEQTIEDAKDLFDELRDKVFSFSQNETALANALGDLEGEANSTIAEANAQIDAMAIQIQTLQGNKTYLENIKAYLEGQVDSLTAERDQLQSELGEANDTIVSLNAEIKGLEGELATVTAELESTQASLVQLQSEYDELLADYDLSQDEVDRLEAELTKANDKVAELENYMTKIKEETEGLNPMDADELAEALETSLDGVSDGDITVENLNLTFMMDGHPDKETAEGERVWRVTNPNAFDVSVNWTQAGGGSGHHLATPGASFYIVDTGNTMTIHWENEDGDTKSNTKAAGY